LEAGRAEDHPEDDVVCDVTELSVILDETPTLEVATEVMNRLPEEYIKFIETEASRSKFKDETSCIEGLRSVLQVLILTHQNFVEEARRDYRFKAEVAARMRELTSKKIALDERLDARIDKAIKRLAQLKTFKQILEDRDSLTKTINHRIPDQRQ
jgi:hypothetical protein